MNVKIQRHLKTYNSVMKIQYINFFFFIWMQVSWPRNWTLNTWSGFVDGISSRNYTRLQKIQSNIHIHIVKAKLFFHFKKLNIFFIIHRICKSHYCSLLFFLILNILSIKLLQLFAYFHVSPAPPHQNAKRNRWTHQR